MKAFSVFLRTLSKSEVSRRVCSVGRARHPSSYTHCLVQSSIWSSCTPLAMSVKPKCRLFMSSVYNVTKESVVPSSKHSGLSDQLLPDLISDLQLI